MRLLLDTHIWIWLMIEPDKVHARVRDAWENGENEMFLSAASVWEIAIKHAAGKIELSEAPEHFAARSVADHQLAVLPITMVHALTAAKLPPHHKDPFDRVLVAQAECEALTLATADPFVRMYAAPVLWAGHG